MVIVIIGGGPAGMLAAIAASKSYIDNMEKVKEPSQIILLEKNEKLGKKLFITGKGRCNVTNDCDRDEFFKNIVRNPKFLYSAYSEFSNKDLENFIEENACPIKIERGNRVFPLSDKSYDIIDAFKHALKETGVKVKLNTEVESIKSANNKELNLCDNGKKIQSQGSKEDNNSSQARFIITTKAKEIILADRVIIATGGRSYQSTGSTGDGYKFAKSFDIGVVNQEPSLVPFNVKELNDCKDMQGLTLKNIGIRIFNINNPKKVIYDDFGELLFTHFGVSGPVILSASCYVGGDNILSIDLKPALSEEQLDARLLREFEDNKNKKLKSVIETLLPSSMVDVFLRRLNALNEDDAIANSVSDLKIANVSKLLRRSIISLLKDFRFTITSKRGFDEAIITRGGVDVKEINPKTMESKKIKGLYFAGEVIDIDAMTGGFNIQIASSTGYLAGLNAGKYI